MSKLEQDIATRKDIFNIISQFYQKLLHDDRMKPFFKEIVDENQLNGHLEIVTDFWQDILFDTTLYKNNTMQKHLDKNTFIAFKKQHFDIWLSYLFEVVDTYFKGVYVDKLKSRATSIAMVMKLKMNVYDSEK